MPLDAPFVLGPFTVDSAGRLRPTDAGSFPAFSLRWRGGGIEVRLARPVDQGAGLIALRAAAGRVPSTASGGNRRAAAFAAMAGLPGLLPAGWRLELQPDHSLRLVAEMALAMPTTATELLCAVTGYLLAAAPYLDLLGEAGLEAPGADAGGMVNTWPG